MAQKKKPLMFKNKCISLWRPLTLFVGILLMLSCHLQKKQEVKPATVQAPTGLQQNQLTRFGDARLGLLAEKLRAKNARVHIVQLGDSHTAADMFTGQLRQRFQARYGDGGPGMVSPLAVPGQRSAVVSFQQPAQRWQLYSTRKETRQDFPFTGLIARPNVDNAPVTLKLTHGDGGVYSLQALYKSAADATLTTARGVMRLPGSENQWQISAPQKVTFPLTATLSMPGQGQLGGWFISSAQPGVILSALGINGATLSGWEKWQSDWLSPLVALKTDMVILAYGTNEAFQDDLDPARYRSQLEKRIVEIRQALPDAVILLIGPPDSIKNKASSACGARAPASLANVIAVQQQVAQSQQILFWDWRAFMGGACAMDRWAASGDARPDRVHLSAEGYKKSADALFDQFSALLASAQ